MQGTKLIEILAFAWVVLMLANTIEKTNKKHKTLFFIVLLLSVEETKNINKLLAGIYLVP